MMEPNCYGVSGVVNGFEYYDWNSLPNPIPDPFPALGFDVRSSSVMDPDPRFPTDPYAKAMPPPSICGSSQDQLSPPSDENESSNPLLKFVSQILLEESIGDKPSMFYDSLALQKTEEMLQRVISDSQTQSFSPRDTITSMGSSDFRSSNGNSSANGGSFDAGNSANSVLAGDPFGNSRFGSNLEFPGSNMLASSGDGPIESSMNGILIRSMFSDTESVLQFKKGLEEAKKFLPSSDQLIINLEPEKSFRAGKRQEVPKAVFVKEEMGREESSDSLRVRKNYEREELDLEETRSHKQAATHVEDGNLTEMFDKVLLLDAKFDPAPITEGEKASSGSVPKKPQAKKEGRRRKKRSGMVDFRTLLILCAQAISTGDRETAHDLLRQIRQESSPFGDASQRVAYHFANGLEARLRGTTSSGIQNYYNSITLKKTTAAEILKAYKVYLSACPFKTLTYLFANKMIIDAAKDASVLHIVDFGILYGFQWPMFIQCISKREGGPPKLRITGIELPQRGFRPAERIEETCRRLAEYGKRFGVPFEYNAVASQNWETIRIDDLKIQTNEVLAVNVGMRFQNLLDETAGEENCPRDTILRLIRDMNPDIFVNSVVNGSYNAPFFTTRFKEALFHYSAFFDMFDSTLPREDPERVRFEREFYGREAMNVIACEGMERVERPETYRQWQGRMERAGFRQKPVESELVEVLRVKLKKWGYHKDFVIDEDGGWFLQGWKGRILYASSCWAPA